MEVPHLQAENMVREPSPLAYILVPIFFPPVWIAYQTVYYITSAVEFGKDIIKSIKQNIGQTLESKVDIINSSKNVLNISLPYLPTILK